MENRKLDPFLTITLRSYNFYESACKRKNFINRMRGVYDRVYHPDIWYWNKVHIKRHQQYLRPLTGKKK